MAAPLVQDDVLTCPDQGTVKVAGDSKMTVGGKEVATTAKVSELSVDACQNKNNKVCGKGLSVMASATKLTVSGSPVVLDSSQITSSTAATLTIVASQTKLTAV
jgi:hypothetical protein